MVEITYDQFFYLLDGEYGYLLGYCTEEKDGVFVDASGKTPSFSTKAALMEFALRNGLRVNRDASTLHQLDAVESWISKSHPHTLDRNEVIATWNLFQDVAKSVMDAGAGFRNADVGLFPIYDKLFWGFTAPPYWVHEGEPYDPELSPEELQTLVELLTIGFRMFRQACVKLD